MQKTAHNFERITVSLPVELAGAINILKDELQLSKSEVLKAALEKFLQEHKKNNLMRAAEIMAMEYKKNKELTSLTALDGEDFK